MGGHQGMLLQESIFIATRFGSATWYAISILFACYGQLCGDYGVRYDGTTSFYIPLYILFACYEERSFASQLLIYPLSLWTDNGRAEGGFFGFFVWRST